MGGLRPFFRARENSRTFATRELVSGLREVLGARLGACLSGLSSTAELGQRAEGAAEPSEPVAKLSPKGSLVLGASHPSIGSGAGRALTVALTSPVTLAGHVAATVTVHDWASMARVHSVGGSGGYRRRNGQRAGACQCLRRRLFRDRNCVDDSHGFRGNECGGSARRSSVVGVDGREHRPFGDRSRVTDLRVRSTGRAADVSHRFDPVVRTMGTRQTQRASSISIVGSLHC